MSSQGYHAHKCAIVIEWHLNTYIFSRDWQNYLVITFMLTENGLPKTPRINQDSYLSFFLHITTIKNRQVTSMLLRERCWNSQYEFMRFTSILHSNLFFPSFRLKLSSHCQSLIIIWMDYILLRLENLSSIQW